MLSGMCEQLLSEPRWLYWSTLSLSQNHIYEKLRKKNLYEHTFNLISSISD